MTPSFLKWHTDSNAVGGALGRMSEYLVLNDPDPVIAAWATAVSVADSDGEQLWLMLVGPPSGSKTESIKTLARVTDAQFSEISTAGLLTQRPGKNGSQPRPATGLLPELGNDCNAFVTISDMSSLLTRGQAGSGRSGSTVSTVFDAFRDIYDGRYQRIQDGVKPSWEGRLTFLAGATTAIDEYGAHSKALGPRWVYMRLRQQDDEQRAATAAKAFSRHEVNERRAEVVEAVASLIESARTRVLDVRISPEVAAIVRESAQLAGYGRASVPRDSRGDISDVAEWEEPARLTHQLKKLASGLLALEVGEDATRRIVRRAAISVIPPMRAIVLHHLATLGENERRSTNHVMREVGRSYKPVKRALEDWAETRVVEMAISDERGQLTQEYEENTPTRDTRARMWRIHPDRRSLVQRGIG